MHIINLIDSLDRINFGVWNPVVSNFAFFIKRNYSPEIWINNRTEIPDELKKYEVKLLDTRGVEACLRHQYTPENTIVISHGCWKIPSKWGTISSKLGFVWLNLPQGMLEPWSRKQNWLKKQIYFRLFEKKMLSQSSELIAVSKDEQSNLERLFNRKVRHIPNGIVPVKNNIVKPSDSINFLFMARLHHKKGILPLLKVWAASQLANNEDFSLEIAGPDDGELSLLNQFMAEQKQKLSNVHIVGPLYESAKEKALEKAHVYVLPSFSEGFPSSILEAASHGCYPVFTKGCNFSEAFDAGVAMRITHEKDSIIEALNSFVTTNVEAIITKGARAKKFVDENYNLEKIGESYISLFEEKMKIFR